MWQKISLILVQGNRHSCLLFWFSQCSFKQGCWMTIILLENETYELKLNWFGWFSRLRCWVASIVISFPDAELHFDVADADDGLITRTHRGYLLLTRMNVNSLVTEESQSKGCWTPWSIRIGVWFFVSQVGEGMYSGSVFPISPVLLHDLRVYFKVFLNHFYWPPFVLFLPLLGIEDWVYKGKFNQWTEWLSSASILKPQRQLRQCQTQVLKNRLTAFTVTTTDLDSFYACALLTLTGKEKYNVSHN